MASVLTQLTYNRLVEAFRRSPGKWAFAAAEAGVDWRTAKRAWTFGWPRRGMPPVEELLENEGAAAAVARDVHREKAEEAKAEEMRIAAEERAKVIKASVEHKRVEGEVANGLLQVAGRLLSNAVKLHRASAPLVDRLETTLQLLSLDAEADGKPRVLEMSARDQVLLLRELGKYSEQVGKLSEVAVRVHRAHLDRPELGMGLGGDTAGNGRQEAEDARRVIEEASRAAERATARAERAAGGALRVIDGGLGQRVS